MKNRKIIILIILLNLTFFIFPQNLLIGKWAIEIIGVEEENNEKMTIEFIDDKNLIIFDNKKEIRQFYKLDQEQQTIEIPIFSALVEKFKFEITDNKFDLYPEGEYNFPLKDVLIESLKIKDKNINSVTKDAFNILIDEIIKAFNKIPLIRGYKIN